MSLELSRDELAPRESALRCVEKLNGKLFELGEVDDKEMVMGECEGEEECVIFNGEDD